MGGLDDVHDDENDVDEDEGEDPESRVVLQNLMMSMMTKIKLMRMRVTSLEQGGLFQ